MRDLGTQRPLNGTLFRFGLSTPTWVLIPLALLATEVLPWPIGYLGDLFYPQKELGGPDLKSHGIVYLIFFVCVFAPLIETAFNQWGCITLLRNRLGAGPWLAVLLSAALFAGLHNYNWKYVLTTFPIGVVLGFVFVVEQPRRRRGFVVTSLVHSLRNGISLLLIFSPM